MRKYIGYGYTNNQGIATLDYDANGTAITPSGYLGTGGGEIDIQAELHDDSSIVSGTFPVLDALYYDSATTDYNSRYSIQSGMTISWANNKYTVSCGASYRTLSISADSTLLNQLKGKDVKFRCTIETSNSVSLAIYVNGSSQTSKSTSTDATVETDSVSVPSDATSFQLRIVGTASQSFSFKDFVVYVG